MRIIGEQMPAGEDGHTGWGNEMTEGIRVANDNVEQGGCHIHWQNTIGIKLVRAWV